MAAGLTDASTDGSTSSGDGGANDGSSNDGGADTGLPGSKKLLDLCAADVECNPGLICRPFTKNGPSRCTRTCASSASCVAGGRCVTIGNESLCVLSDVGRACTAAANCEYACLTGPGYCTMPCASGSDCPNGYGCQMVASQSVCVKAEVGCDGAPNKCVVPAACDTNFILSSCTLACNTAADCPQRAAGLAAWTCNGICQRPGDVYGPLGQGVPAEYLCNAQSTVVNACNDGQHMDFNQFTVPAPPAVSCAATMTTPGVAGDTCVDSCRYQGGCAFGFMCTAVGSVGNNRIGLCLPALGGGEVGANCTRDGDCAFGYCNRTAGRCSRDCTSDGVCPTGSTCTAAGAPSVEGLPFRRCE